MTMALADRSPLESLIEQLRARTRSEHATCAERVARLHAAVEAYAQAMAQERAAVLARQAGLEVPSGTQGAALEAARTLLDVVRELPELAGEETAREAPVEPPVNPRRRLVEVTPPTASAWVEALALLAEVQRCPLETLPDELFAAHVEELAVYARLLQDKARDEGTWVTELDVVIRKLTAQVHQRGLKGIYGLSRRHKGPWEPRLARARARRRALEASAE